MTTDEPKNINESDERVIRIEKIEKLKKAGINPYQAKYAVTHSAAAIEAYAKEHTLRDGEAAFAAAQEIVKTAGRIMTVRHHGGIAFLNLQDMTGQVQICLKEDVLGKETFDTVLERFEAGDFIGVSGEPFMTKQGKLAVLAVKAELLSKATRPLPDKYHGVEDIEIIYRKRYLDLITNAESRERFLVRSRVVQELRNWLLEHNFIELMTRTLQPQAGGAMAETFSTHHNALDHDFHLRISPELDLKMAVIGGFERVFEFSTNFRNEGIDPSHLQEFQELEWYAAYNDYETGMDWTEDMFHQVVTKAFGKTTFSVYDKEEKLHEISFEGSFPRVTFAELLKKHADTDIFAPKEDLLKKAAELGLDPRESAKRSRSNLLDDIYKKTARPKLISPIFVTHYPTDLVPLARPNDADPRLADSYQLVVCSWEIVKAYSELADPLLQRKMLEEQAAAKKAGDAEAMQVDEEFLTAMEHGMPPVTGWGMGIDRFVTLLTGQRNLRDTVLFPLMKSEKKEEKAEKKEE